MIGASRRRRRERLSTCTVTDTGRLVPWLAAEGPLAYTPEAPPDRDYYFQYGWVLPGVFADHTNTRRHFYFGAGSKERERDLFAFWQVCREAGARRIAHFDGSIGRDSVAAPLAIYHLDSSWRAG